MNHFLFNYIINKEMDEPYKNEIENIKRKLINEMRLRYKMEIQMQQNLSQYEERYNIIIQQHEEEIKRINQNHEEEIKKINQNHEEEIKSIYQKFEKRILKLEGKEHQEKEERNAFIQEMDHEKGNETKINKSKFICKKTKRN